MIHPNPDVQEGHCRLKRWFCQQSERESEAAVEGVGAVDAKYNGRGTEAVLDRS